VKKDADAISAYVMSESLWYLSRQLPRTTPSSCRSARGYAQGRRDPGNGLEPATRFGRVYARPDVARWLDERVVRLLNDPAYGWEGSTPS